MGVVALEDFENAESLSLNFFILVNVDATQIVHSRKNVESFLYRQSVHDIKNIFYTDDNISLNLSRNICKNPKLFRIIKK